MKRLKKRMLANSGFSYVITSVLMICVLLIGVAVFEVIRLYIQAGAVRDKFEDSIISMCVENYSEPRRKLPLQRIPLGEQQQGERAIYPHLPQPSYERRGDNAVRNRVGELPCRAGGACSVGYRFGAEICGFRNAGGAYSVPLCMGKSAADRDVAGRSVAVAGEVLNIVYVLLTKLWQ